LGCHSNLICTSALMRTRIWSRNVRLLPEYINFQDNNGVIICYTFTHFQPRLLPWHFFLLYEFMTFLLNLNIIPIFCDLLNFRANGQNSYNLYREPQGLINNILFPLMKIKFTLTCL